MKIILEHDHHTPLKDDEILCRDRSGKLVSQKELFSRHWDYEVGVKNVSGTQYIFMPFHYFMHSLPGKHVWWDLSDVSVQLRWQRPSRKGPSQVLYDRFPTWTRILKAFGYGGGLHSGK